VILCKEYYKIQNSDENIETIPRPNIMYKIIRDLALRVESLENKNRILEMKLGSHEKKTIISYLNQRTTAALLLPENIKMGFSKWILHFNVQFSNLKCVFDKDLTEGIKSVILDLIGKDKNIQPICAFTQKPNHLYVYDIVETHTPANTSGMSSWSWKVLRNDELSIFIEKIRKKILLEFTKWHRENINSFSTEEEKEEDLNNMLKINGNKVSLEKRVDTIKKWLYCHLEQQISISSVEF